MHYSRRRRTKRSTRNGEHCLTPEQLIEIPHYKRLVAAGVAHITALIDTRKLMEHDPKMALRQI